MNLWTRFGAIALATPLMVSGPVPGMKSTVAQTATSWLDGSTLTNWNRSGGSIPRPTPTGEGNLGVDESCRGQVRSPFTRLDQQITRAGWSLYGAVQTYNRVTVISAMTGADGMCRPMGYQYFVFVGDRFAGTLSPAPMASRSEGSSRRVYLQNESQLSVDFNRYTDQDALCCPSRTSTVSYRIQSTPRGPLLVPAEVFTQPNASST